LIILGANPSFAESASAAIEAFGLAGTWSLDCAQDMSKPCTEAAARTARCNFRMTFRTSLSEAPTR
jgi:hypothetical protein